MIRKIFTFPIDLLEWLSNRFTRLFRRSTRASGDTKVLYATERTLTRFLARLWSPFEKAIDLLSRLTAGKRREVSYKYDSTLDTSQVNRKLEKRQRAQLRRQWWLGFLPFRFLRMLLKPFGLVTRFFQRLFRRYGWSLFVYSLPVLTVVGVLSYAVFHTAFQNKEQLAARYQQAVAKAIQSGDFEQAGLFDRKLEQLGLRTKSGEVQRALALADAGRLEEAAAVMQSVASPNQPGQAAAHFWLAQHLLAGDVELLKSPTAAETALLHVQQLRNQIGNRPEIQYFTATALWKLNRPVEALNALGDAPGTLLEAAGLKLSLDIALGDLTSAQADATTLQRHLNRLRDSGQQFTEMHNRWETAVVEVLGDRVAANEAVDRWYNQNPNSPEARLRKAIQLFREFDDWQRNADAEQVDGIAEKFVMACRLVPKTDFRDVVARRLNRISTLQNQPAFEKLRAIVLQADPVLADVCSFYATKEAENQNWRVADRLFQRAAEGDPEDSVVWNNWAYVLNEGFPDRRKEALEHGNRAVELEPENPDYRETRGTILLNLERWQAAVDDLTLAANGISNVKAVHQKLAIAYRGLGDQRMSSLHQKEFERLK